MRDVPPDERGITWHEWLMWDIAGQCETWLIQENERLEREKEARRAARAAAEQMKLKGG